MGVGRGASQTGLYQPFAAVEAASPTGTSESRNPHFAYNKTIPYRFVLVKDAAMP
jgi:hypothetical protein